MVEPAVIQSFVVRWPGKVKPGSTSDALVGQVDFLALFARLTDQKLDAGDGPDSHDLLDVLLDASSHGRNTYVEQNGYGTMALLKADWKYIEPHAGQTINKATGIATGNDPKPRLYDLRKDIGERGNLAAKYPARVKEMATELQSMKEGSRVGK